MGAKRFRIAFSFAGEKRAFVGKVADLLAQSFGEEAILYDKFHEAEFARARLGFYLPKLYNEQSDLVVVVICRDYVYKEWCGLEWDAIFDLIKRRREIEVMLSRFDHATVNGLFSDAGFSELDHKTPEKFAVLILERLALNEGNPKDYYTKLSSAGGKSPPRSPVPPQTSPRKKKMHLATIMLVLIILVGLGTGIYWHFFAPHAIQTTGVEALEAYFEKMRATAQQVYPNVAKKEATPRVPDSWVKSDPTEGMLSFFGLSSVFDDVKAIRIVDPRDNSTRSIDLLRNDESPDRVDPNFLRDVRPSNLNGVPVPFGSSPISVQLDYKDQRHTETQQISMTNPGIECIKLAQTSVGTGGKAPALYAAYEPVVEELVFLPIAPNGTLKTLYAFRNGSYQVFDRADSRIWGVFQRMISQWKPSDTISLLFQLGDAREFGPFEYSLAGIQDMVRRSLKQQVLQRWREMIQCKRVAFNFPVPATHNEAEYSVKRKLISANLDFIEEAPVLVCIPSRAGWSGHSYQSFGNLWAAVREVRFGPEPSQLPYIATPGINVQTFIETPRIVVDVKWRVLMPPNLQSVYVQFVFFDGGMTEPKSIPIEDITP
jgi:hypothetical protein